MHVHTDVHTCVCMHTYANLSAYIHKYTHMYTDTQGFIHAISHIYTHAHISSLTQTCSTLSIHKHTKEFAYAHNIR